MSGEGDPVTRFRFSRLSLPKLEALLLDLGGQWREVDSVTAVTIASQMEIVRALIGKKKAAQEKKATGKTGQVVEFKKAKN